MIVKRVIEPRPPTLPKDYRAPLVPRYQQPKPNISAQRVAEIVDEIAAVHYVHPNLILGRSRKPPIVAARHAYIAAVMREYKLTLSHASVYLELDRDTIRNALKRNMQREVEELLRQQGVI